MTTIAEIITDAYRDNNLIAVGKQPTTDEQTEGLRRLNAFFRSIFGLELGVELRDWTTPPSRTEPIPARYSRKPLDTDLPSDVWPYPPNNSRLLLNIATATTIYFPSKPQDGSRMSLVDVASSATLTIDANGRKIEGALTKAVGAPLTEPLEWFYRADLSEWVSIKDLIVTDESPLPDDFDDFLILALSTRLSARVGKTASIARADLKRMTRKLKTRYRQAKEPTLASDLRIGTLSANGNYYTGGDLLT